MESEIKGRVFPPPGPSRALALAQLISRTGDGAYYVTAALFFTQVAGMSSANLGLGLTLGWTVALVLGVPLGHFSDRVGARGAAIVFLLCAALAVGSYTFIRSFPLFVVTASVYAVGQRSGAAAQQALLAGSVPKDDVTKARAFIQSCYNAGLAAGAGLGGIVLLFDSHEAYLAAFALNSCAFVSGAIVLLNVPTVPRKRPLPKGERQQSVIRDRPYVTVSLINMILVLHMPLADVALPLWVVHHTTAPKWVLSVVFLLNTLAVVAFQIRVARGVTDLRCAARYVAWAGALLGAGCMIFAFSGSGHSAWSAVLLLLAASAVVTAGELMQSAGTWEISFGLAADERQGLYQAFFGSGLTVAEIVGPLGLTALLVYWGAPGWILLGVLFAVAGLAMIPTVRWGEHKLETRCTTTSTD